MLEQQLKKTQTTFYLTTKIPILCLGRCEVAFPEPPLIPVLFVLDINSKTPALIVNWCMIVSIDRMTDFSFSHKNDRT